MTVVPFAEWRPDVAGLNSSFTDDIMNVLCADGAYIPFPELVPYSTALPEAPVGAFSATASDGTIVIFAGTATRLYKFDATDLGWDHVSKLEADQVVNGTFAADTDWNKAAGATIAAGVGTLTAVAGGTAFSQSQSFTAGVIYKVTFTVSGFSAGGVRLIFASGTAVTGTTRTANGTYTEYLTAATGNDTFAIQAVGTTTLNVDDVSVEALVDYGATTTERWRFAQYGDFVVAVNTNDAPQVFEIGTSTEFADLAGSPPRARHVAVWGDFLALGGINGNENRVQWSDIDDITEWSTGLSGSQDFPDGGDVMGMTSATNPIIFQKGAIRFATFVPGSTIVFTFQKVHDKRGAAAPYAIASRGAFTFFADAGGFFQIGPDGAVIPIGYEKIDRTVFGNIDGSDLYSIIGEVDPFFTRVYWAVKYDSTGSSFDRLIVYDWNLQRWTQIGGDIDILFPLASGTIGYTLEGLDTISASIDALGISLDSKVWQGGAPVMAAFDTDNKLGFFSGSASEATLTTQEMGDTAGAVSMVTSIYTVVDTGNVFVSIGARFRRSDVPVWSNEVQPSSNTSMVHKRSRARFHRFKVRIPEDDVWTYAQGLDVKTVAAGMR